MFHPDYVTASDFEVVVNFTWSYETSPSGHEIESEDLTVEYRIIITGIQDEPVNLTTHDHASIKTSFAVALEMNRTYSITLYASRCNHTLTSDPFVTNITIDKVFEQSGLLLHGQ